MALDRRILVRLLVGKSVCGGVIGGDAGGSGLFVAHGFEYVAHVCCFLAIVEEGSNFRL